MFFFIIKLKFLWQKNENSAILITSFGRSCFLKALTHCLQIVYHPWTEAKDLCILLSQGVYIINVKVKKLHIMNVVGKLVETDVGYGAVLLVVVHFFHWAALDVPETESGVGLGFTLFDFVLLVNTFEETALPPLDVLPYFMVLDVGLKVNFLALFVNKMVSKRQHHELFGIVSV